VLFGVLTLGVSVIIERALKRKQGAIEGSLLSSELIRSAAHDRAAVDRIHAARVKEERVAVIAAAHDATVKKLTEKQAAVMSRLLDSPEALNVYLIRVGREMRNAR